jgi:hypothetical protein
MPCPAWLRNGGITKPALPRLTGCHEFHDQTAAALFQWTTLRP